MPASSDQTPELGFGDSALVLGFGLYGRAVAAALVGRGVRVTVVEDRPSDDTASEATELGVGLLVSPDADSLRSVLTSASAFLPSPGVPEHHAAFAVAASVGVPTLSEFDLARWWDDRPIAAITGTDGKTTVTMLTVAMLREAGMLAEAVGNTDVPLVTAIEDPGTDVFVVEASSFRLGHTERFTPQVAAWLNWGPDHLDVHVDLERYELAKARIFADLDEGALAVATISDEVVMRHVPPDRRVVTVGDGGAATLVGDRLMVGELEVATLDDLPRSFEHDITNTLTAAVIALEFGASVEDIRAAIRSHKQLPHRIQFVTNIAGIDWYNDSKATVPHAVVSALRSFDRAVLIAGGRNKGLDLSEIRDADDHVSAVVAIGEAADEIITAFGESVPIVPATSMDAAVAAAASLAEPGDVVLLSPGCASYDQYTSYGARGDDFIRAVNELASTYTAAESDAIGGT